MAVRSPGCSENDSEASVEKCGGRLAARLEVLVMVLSVSCRKAAARLLARILARVHTLMSVDRASELD